MPETDNHPPVVTEQASNHFNWVRAVSVVIALAVVVLLMLALMGPAVGNVFSNTLPGL